YQPCHVPDKPAVDQDEPSVASEEDIAWLDVAVHLAGFVQSAKAPDQLHRRRAQPGVVLNALGCGIGAHEGEEIGALDQLHREEALTVRDVEVVQPDQVGMGEGANAGFRGYRCWAGARDERRFSATSMRRSRSQARSTVPVAPAPMRPRNS